MDYYSFFEDAADDRARVKVTMANGEIFTGVPRYLDESLDDGLGYTLDTDAGCLYGVPFYAIESAERIPAEA
jgi:hypothetical protein